MAKTTVKTAKSKKTTLSRKKASTPSLFSSKFIAKNRLIVFIVLFGIIGTVALMRSFAASTKLFTLEAESMSLPDGTTGASVVGDTTASGGKVLYFSGNVLAVGSADLTGKPASNKLVIKAKGANCKGEPQLRVKINNAQAKTFVVASSWSTYTYEPTIAANSNPQISVEFINPYEEYKGKSANLKCSRDLHIDTITFFEVTPDTITANITTPSSSTATVSSGIAIEAKPVSSNGISKVEFYVGGTKENGYLDGTLTTETLPPYCLAADSGTAPCHEWNSTATPVANGIYPITAYAYDAEGVRSEPHTVTVTVENQTTTDPGNTTNPSGEAIPIGNLPGWRQIFTDDFNTNVPLGSFPAAVSDKWGAYPYPWRDTKGQRYSDPTLGGWYHPEKTVSIQNGMMDIWMHTELLDGAKKRLVAAPQPKIKGPGTSAHEGQLYGRYAVRFRVDTSRTTNNFTGYKTAWLLWPTSKNWPKDGEIDFPEGDLNNFIKGFLHKQDATVGSDQYYAKSTKTYSDWHTAVIEWEEGRGAFYLDGQFITDASGGKSEWFDRIPNSPMRYVLQSETMLDSTVPAENTEGRIQIDWVAIWAKN